MLSNFSEARCQGQEQRFQVLRRRLTYAGFASQWEVNY